MNDSNSGVPSEDISPQFLNIDSTKATWRDYRFSTPLILMPLAMLLKVLRIRLPGPTDIPNIQSLTPFETEQLPATPHDDFAPLIDQLQQQGFNNPPIYHSFDDPFTSTTRHFATLSRQPGQAIVRLYQRIVNTSTPAKQYNSIEFISPMADGSFLVTTSGTQDTLDPPLYNMQRMLNASPLELWTAHQQRLKQHTSRSMLPPDHDTIYTRQILEDFHGEARDFHLQRGFFYKTIIPHNDELDNISLDDLSPQDITVYHEMTRLKTKQSKLRSVLILLGLSLAAFVAIGIFAWDATFIALIVPILLIHEAGHFIAMKCFGYKDLRMFFIPFLGAAVSGRAYHVAGWKQVIVFLMGPLPGILLGIACLIAGEKLEIGWLNLYGITSIAINAFNLLPFLPLDGGRVLQTVLFARHYWLDTAFRALTTLLLAALWINFDDRFLMFLAIFIGFTIPLSFRIGRVTSQMRQQGLTPTPQDNTLIPKDIAVQIIQRTRDSTKTKLNAKNLAQQSLMVFESLTTKPPGWFASIALLTLHASAFVISIAAIALITPGVSDFIRYQIDAAFTQPVQYLSLQDITVRNHQGQAYATGPYQVTTLVAQLDDPPTDAQWQNWTSELPATGAMLQMGDFLLATLPDDDEALHQEWVERIPVPNDEIQINPHNSLSSSPLLGLRFTAPTKRKAQIIEKELYVLLKYGFSELLIPPWAANDPRSPTQQTKDQNARDTLRKLSDSGSQAHEEPAVIEINQKIRQLYSTENAEADPEITQAKYEELDAKLSELLNQSGIRNAKKAMSEPGMDSAVSNHFLEYLTLSADYNNSALSEEELDAAFESENKHYNNHAHLMGSWQDIGVKPNSPLRKTTAESGNLYLSDTHFTVSYIELHHPAISMPQLIDWLNAHGCENITFHWSTHIYSEEDLKAMDDLADEPVDATN